MQREELKACLATLDDRAKKIVGGVLAVMFQNPERVREREWISEQFTQVALLAGDWEESRGGQSLGSVDEALTLVQAYARDNIDPILNASYGLFACVGEDLASKDASQRTPEAAMLAALTYF